MREKYTVQEASDLTGLSVGTLRQYLYTTDLVRGEDFYIHRFARFRRRTYWTARGIARLKTRSYRVNTEPKRVERMEVNLPLPRRYAKGSREEKAARMANAARIIYGKYFTSPCAVPNCPCMVHRLGLPQADEIIAAVRRAV